MKTNKIKTISYGIILLVVILVSGILLENNHNMKQWHDNINNIAQPKDQIEQIQIIQFTPGGKIKYDVEREKYDYYISFIKSLEVFPCDNELLSGTSVCFIIRYEDKTEFKALFMGNYVTVNNEYFYRIKNYSEVEDIFNNII